MAMGYHHSTKLMHGKIISDSKLILLNSSKPNRFDRAFRIHVPSCGILTIRIKTKTSAKRWHTYNDVYHNKSNFWHSGIPKTYSVIKVFSEQISHLEMSYNLLSGDCSHSQIEKTMWSPKVTSIFSGLLNYSETCFTVIEITRIGNGRKLWMLSFRMD